MASAVVGALRVLLSADTAQFDKSLQGAQVNVERLSKAMSRDLASSQTRVNSLVKSFLGSKEIGLANDFARSVQQIGGAAKLTANDQSRVNKVVQEALAHYKALGKEAPSHLIALANATKQVQVATSQVTPIVGALQGQWLKLTSAFAAGALLERGLQGIASGFGILADFMQDSIKEFVEAEQIQRKVTAALQAQGTAIPSVIVQFDALANKYKELTVNSDEAIKETQALLVQVGGVLPSEMDRALDAVTNLSAGLGIDLRSAAMMVSKSFEDNFGALKKAGIAIDETRAKSEGMVYVLGKIQERFGGQARAEMQSYAGQIKQLENNFADFKEEVGRTFAESGALSVGLSLARAGVQLLSLEFIRLVSVINTMPSLTDVASIGVGASVPVWVKRQSAEFNRMVKSMQDTRKQASLAGGQSGVSQEEFWVGLSRDEEDQRTKDLAKIGKDREDALKRSTAAAKQHAEEIKRVEEAYQSWKRALLGLSDAEQKQLNWERRAIHEGHIPAIAALINVKDQTDALLKGNGLLTASILTVGESYAEVSRRIAVFADLVGPADFGKLLKGGLAFDDLIKGINFPAEKLRKTLSGLFMDAPRAILQAFQGGGSISKTLSSLFGGGIFGSESVLGKMGVGALEGQFQGGLGKMLQGTFGKNIGGMIANIIPGLGALIGPALEKLFSAIGSIGQNTTKKARDQFAEQFGGLDALYKQLQTMGAAGQALANTGLNVIGKKDKAANEKWMKDVQTFLDAVPKKFEALTAAVEKFGGVAPKAVRPLIEQLLASNQLTADMRKQLEGLMGAPAWQRAAERAQALGVDPASLGSGFNQARIQDTAFSLLHDIQLFEEFNKNVMDFLPGVGDELSALVAEAIKTGAALPKTLEPYIKQLDAMGLLLDENGNRIEMGAVSFKDIEDEALKQIVSVLEDIRDLLGGKLPAAVKEFGKSLIGLGDIEPRFRMPRLMDDFSMPAMPSYSGISSAAMAAGSGWMPSASGGAGGGTAIIQINSRTLAEVIVPDLPGATKRYSVGRS